MATNIKEFAKEHKLSQSISARLYPYQRLSASTYQQFLDAARSWMNSRSHSNSLNLTSHGSYQQRGHQTFDRRITWESLISIRVQEKGRKSRLGKSHNIILANSILVPKAPMATEQTTDKAVELGSFFTLTHSTAGHTLS